MERDKVSVKTNKLNNLPAYFPKEGILLSVGAIMKRKFIPFYFSGAPISTHGFFKEPTSVPL